jgi:DNA-binding response OmpR family regulator
MATLSRTSDFASPAPLPVGPVNHPARILVLDDDDDIREIYVVVLIQSGYEVDAAANGQAGWEALHARPYDLLITDNEMPGLNGLELVNKICTSGMTLPIIFASGSLSPWEVQMHASVHIAAALPKPFTPDELVKTVQRVLCGKDVADLAHNGKGSSCA